MLWLLACVCAMATLVIRPAAHAQKRMALIIGNTAYEHTAKLENPMAIYVACVTS
jgi:hypothetical protein